MIDYEAGDLNVSTHLKARRKKNKSNPLSPLPIIQTSKGTVKKFTGCFNLFSVIVTDSDEMQTLYQMGCFGKGNLSRSRPSFNIANNTPIIRKRVFNRRKNWDEGQKQKIIVVPDSESETEDYFTNLKPEFNLVKNSLVEVTHLSLEEAFFLSYYLKCLDIYSDGLLVTDIWKLFTETDEYFIQNYPVYHYFRSKNWVVKPGIKFGGDFLLYKDGPAFYHASYVIIIDILDNTTLKQRNDLCRRSMLTDNITALNRLCESVGKELIICQLLWPSHLTINEPQDLTKLSINEIVMQRWISSQNKINL